jgi:hypothetical protein
MPDVYESKGGDHDFKAYKGGAGNFVGGSTPAGADPAYAGTKECRRNSFIPARPSKNPQLAEGEKAYNKELARRRVVFGHINAKIKTFKSAAYACRRRNRHSLGMDLICGLINYDRNV